MKRLFEPKVGLVYKINGCYYECLVWEHTVVDGEKRRVFVFKGPDGREMRITPLRWYDKIAKGQVKEPKHGKVG